MYTYLAGSIGLNPDDFTGDHVEFADYHGRAIIGTLQAAAHTVGAAHATLTVGGRDYAVFANTPVTVTVVP